jgi:Reverse transcriptase (RNA-dependent DNA polymerase)
VSRESVRIALTLAALNDLEVKTSDIENACLTAPVAEKIWTVLGPEFGADKGKKAIVVRSLYGLKSSGAAFRNHLADCMRHLGWKSCLADPDLWYKAEVRPSDKFQYYAYDLLYVDDALIVHHDATAALEKLDYYFKMKKGSFDDPDFTAAVVSALAPPPLVAPPRNSSNCPSSTRFPPCALKKVPEAQPAPRGSLPSGGRSAPFASLLLTILWSTRGRLHRTPNPSRPRRTRKRTTTTTTTSTTATRTTTAAVRAWDAWLSLPFSFYCCPSDRGACQIQIIKTADEGGWPFLFFSRRCR